MGKRNEEKEFFAALEPFGFRVEETNKHPRLVHETMGGHVTLSATTSDSKCYVANLPKFIRRTWSETDSDLVERAIEATKKYDKPKNKRRG